MTIESTTKFKSAVVAPSSNMKKIIQPRTLLQRDRGQIDSQILISNNHIGRHVTVSPSVLKTSHEAEQHFASCPKNNDTVWIRGDYQSLPEIPLFYPIERTSTVVNCRDPREIADRIMGCLRKLSIAAKFNSLEVSRTFPFCLSAVIAFLVS